MNLFNKDRKQNNLSVSKSKYVSAGKARRDVFGFYLICDLKNVVSLFAIAIVTLLLISTPVLAGSGAPQWSYGGSENPTQWGKLSKNFAQCELGKDQSPINIQNAVDGSPAKIDFDYKPSPLEVVNNGRS